MIQTYLILVPIIALFGSIGWVTFFIEVYPHFPKMDKSQRIAMSIGIATALTIFLILIVFAFLYVFFTGMFK